MRAKVLLRCLLTVPIYASKCDASWRVEDCSEFVSSFQKTGHEDVTILNSSHIPEKAINISGTLNAIPVCRLFGSVPYAGNNSIIFELWLPPIEKHNERFLVVGNGGMAGTIGEGDVIRNLNKGFAVAGGDSGHLAAMNNDGNGVPGVYLPYMHDKQQVKAWIHNSIAFLTPAAKKITTAFYDQVPKYSYYEGYSHLALSFLWNSQMTQGPNFLPQTVLDFITQTVLDKCDTIDGVKDGVLENPLLCDFDISSLECKSSGTNSSACFTPAQIATAQKIYTGPVDSRSNITLYPGFSVGSETEWMLQEGYLADIFSIPILQNMLFNNLSYDASTFNWGTDVDAVNARVGTLIDETSPDLSALKASGAKMIVSQGWSDPFNAATWPIQHLGQIEDFFGGDVSDWFRLFMIPGGGHCGAATNYPQVPAIWHALDAVVQWVETGQPPTQMLGTDPTDKSLKNKTSKLCPWPQTAKFRGGDTNNWNSFECEN
ncbi:feruloyl esterase [Hypoxylon cercidicola]|nr:feruloyl esterase [Hypoxylon cercidicola]